VSVLQGVTGQDLKAPFAVGGEKGYSGDKRQKSNNKWERRVPTVSLDLGVGDRGFRTHVRDSASYYRTKEEKKSAGNTFF